MVSALILAGGRATRFGGIAKHEIVIDGETIFARQVRVLAPRVGEIVISAPRDVAGYRTVRDQVDGGGPLAGIAAGLRAVSTPWLLVVAGDMPNLHPAMIDLMIAARADDIDAIGLRVGGLPEPLFCMLHARAQGAVERRLAAKRYKASGLLTEEALRVRWIEEEALRAIDPELTALVNVNKPDDMPR
ncbi:MAG: molybdopterin-guanine dinucleotide biosynthesis protein [Myxococcales bacterium]|nr:molybdopterin-guanine dinucleotide biosynthesis protein [Myxococcales bacterium]